MLFKVCALPISHSPRFSPNTLCGSIERCVASARAACKLCHGASVAQSASEL